MDLQTGAWVESVAPPAAITWLEGLKKSGLSAKVSLANQLVLTQLLGAIAKAPSQAADLALVLGDLLGGLLTTAETHPPFTQSVCFTGLNSDVEAMEKKVQLQENTRECPVFALVVGPGPVRARAAHLYDCSEKQFNPAPSPRSLPGPDYINSNENLENYSPIHPFTFFSWLIL